MNKINNNIKNNFTIIPNEILRNNKISDRARFLFCYMASMPDNWKFYNRSMANDLGYSEETLRKYIDELLTTGYLQRFDRRDGGRFDSYDYVIDFIPNSNECEKSPCEENTDTVKHRHGILPTRHFTDTGKLGTNNTINTTNTNNTTNKENTTKEKSDFLFCVSVKENIKKEKKGLAQKKEIKKLIHTHISNDFLGTWQILISEPKWRRKSHNALQGCLNMLSEYSEADAIQIMKNSINGGWQGLFPLDNKKQTIKLNQNGKQHSTSTESILSVIQARHSGNVGGGGAEQESNNIR